MPAMPLASTAIVPGSGVGVGVGLLSSFFLQEKTSKNNSIASIPAVVILNICFLVFMIVGFEISGKVTSHIYFIYVVRSTLSQVLFLVA